MVLGTNTLHELHGCGDPGDAFLILRARLRTFRRRVGCRLDLRKWKGLQKIASRVQDPDVRPVELVGATRQEVAADSLDVDRRVRREMNGVDEQHGADRVGDRSRALEIVDGADGIGRAAQGDESRLPAGELLEMRVVDLRRLADHSRASQNDSAIDFQRPPRGDVPVVIELGHDHFIARLPCPPKRATEVEGQRGHVRAEGDLLRRGVDQIRHRLA